MRHLKVVAAVAALALLVAPAFRSKPVLSIPPTLMTVGPKGDFKSLEEVDAWMVKTKRRDDSLPVLIMVTVPQTNCVKWLNSLDLKAMNLSVQIKLSDPRLSCGELAHAPHFELQQ